MKMLCPFFHCPCHEDDCQAFERVKNKYGGIRIWGVAVSYFADVPEQDSDWESDKAHIYCHALNRRLPIVLEDKE